MTPVITAEKLRPVISGSEKKSVSWRCAGTARQDEVRSEREVFFCDLIALQAARFYFFVAFVNNRINKDDVGAEFVD